MLQYLLTAVAGIALGIVAMRVWQARDQSSAAEAVPEQPPVDPAGAAPTARPTTRYMLVGAAALTVAGVAALALRTDDPAAGLGAVTPATAAPGAAKAVDDVDTMIDRLAARLAANPADGEGYRMLGWSYAMTGRPEKAIAPYQRALALLPKSALVHSGYGEALAGVAKGVVTPEAKAEFERAVALDPQEPRARYFLALWQAQHGDERAALDKWIVLANSGPADAPWQGDVRRKITEVSAKLGTDVSARLKPAGAAPAGGASPPPLDAQTIQAANAMPDASRQAMVAGMVDGLAAKLKADPSDPDRWILLLRSRMVLKQADQASSDLAAARRALAGNSAALTKVDTAARDLGVPAAR